MNETTALRIGTLVLIDDEEMDHLLYRRTVERSGLVDELITFLSAEEALEFLRSDDRPEIDAILLDINMPRMNGFEFLDAAEREIGHGFAQMVVIMLTTSLNPEDRARADACSMVKDYLSKPLCAEHLEKIARMLRT